MSSAYQFIDPAQLVAMRDLQIVARAVVEGMMTGMHRSPHSGTSIEFAQYRPYAQGDDTRFIDWRLYARTDRLHVKQYRDETNLRCTLLLDCSGSMDYGSHKVTKFDYARMLTACLATVLHAQNDATGLVAYHHDLVERISPRVGAAHIRRIYSRLESLRAEGEGTDTAGALHYLGDVITPRGMVVLISDLLHPVEDMIDHLKSLRARRHEVIVFQVSDPAEQNFPFENSATFVDAESKKEQFAVPSAVRAGYLENRKAHFDLIRKECLASEIELHEYLTTEPLDRALHYFFRRRMRLLMTSSSRTFSRGARRS